MKVLIDNIRYDTNKCDLVASLEEANPRGRDTGLKRTSLFQTKDNKFLLLLEYIYKQRLFDSICVKVSCSKAFDFAKNLASLDQLEQFFPSRMC